jgi:hypothetical protein
MAEPEPIRRRRGRVDDVIGGTLSFVIELGIVLGLGVIALAVAAIASAVL